MSKKKSTLVIEECLLILSLVVGLSVVGGYVFMLLWNWAVVGVFGLNSLSFLQAWGMLLFLTYIGGLSNK